MNISKLFSALINNRGQKRGGRQDKRPPVEESQRLITGNDLMQMVDY